MFTAILMLSITAASMEVWTTSTLCPLYEASRTSPAASESARLCAAQGETESFLVYVRAGRKGARGLSVMGKDIAGPIPAPAIFAVTRVALDQPSPRSFDGGATAVDCLDAAVSRDLKPSETAMYWAACAIPRDAKPGLYDSEIEIRSEDRRPVRLPVRIEVFGFALPESPTLRSLATLDRQAITRFYPISDASLDAWKPVYDALSPYGLSYTVWDGNDLVSVRADGSFDASLLTEHLDYAVRAAQMNCIDVSANGLLTRLMPPPTPSALQDPLQFYLHDVGNWLIERGWIERACVVATSPSGRDTWLETRSALHRFWRADKRFSRVLIAPLHPFWERYCESWAAPFLAYDPQYAARLQSGRSVAGRPLDTAAIHASKSANTPEGYRSAPEDAVDGSRATAWYPAGFPASLDVHFDRPLTIFEVTLVWRGARGRDIRISVTYDGAQFGRAASTWRDTDALGFNPQPVSIATLSYEKNVLGLRIEFRDSGRDGPAGLAEIMLGDLDTPESAEPVPPVAPWLALTSDRFPSQALDADPVEMRLIPWVCFGSGLTGFTGLSLNRWPATWYPGALGSAPSDGRFLVYPGTEGIAPSLRMMRLRDGIEDFEYLRALAEAVKERRIDASAARKLARPPLFGPHPAKDELGRLAEYIEKTRIAVGRALSGLVLSAENERESAIRAP